MNARNWLLTAGASAVLAVAGFVALGEEVFAEGAVPLDTPATADPEPTPPPAEEPPTAASAPVAVPLAAVREAKPAPDTRGWTKGMVRGDIQLAVSVLDRLGAITVEVVEARSAIERDGKTEQPTRIVVPVERGRGTPTFQVDVPFSAYPYVVTVRAAGLNGSQSTITIDEQQPVADVVLAITAGTPLSILARDQDLAAFVGLDVTLVPTERSRKPHTGTTDNYGSLVFAEVLAGDYQVLAMQDNQPVMDPQMMTVHPGGRSLVQGQSYTLSIERGVPVDVLVHDRNGYPFPDTKVTATATDRIKLTVREAITDAAGFAKLPPLGAGTWQITVARDQFYQWDKQITLTPHQPPLRVDCMLVPARR
jgi:hypothetical protein